MEENRTDIGTWQGTDKDPRTWKSNDTESPSLNGYGTVTRSTITQPEVITDRATPQPLDTEADDIGGAPDLLHLFNKTEDRKHNKTVRKLR